MTTPDGLKTLTNGRRVSRVVHDGRVTSHWRSGPMSTHLTFLAIGDYAVERGRVAGVPAWYAYERGAMTLQALRNKIGGQTFFTIGRRWVRQYSGRTAPTVRNGFPADLAARSWRRPDGLAQIRANTRSDLRFRADSGLNGAADPS